MAASTRRDLFLQVSADVSPLTAASKAGRTALLNLGSTADDVAAEVEKAFRDLGNGSVASSAKSIERSFDSTFANIRRNAAAVMNAPTGKAALQILDTAGVEQAAMAAETQAAALRRVAEAAAIVAQRAGEAGDAERVLAVSSEVAAQRAEQQATAMRAQANVIASVATEVRANSLADVAANDEVVKSHGRMGASGMIAEHVVRSLSDSMAAGQSPVRALGMEMGRITEAMTLYAQTTDIEGTGKMAKFASFMAGPYGLAVSVGAAVLVPLIGHLVEMGSASEDAMDKIKEEAKATDANRTAKEAFKRTEEGVTEAINASTDAVSKSIEAQRTEAERVNINTRGQLAYEMQIRRTTIARLQDAQAQLNADKTRAQGGGQRGELGGIAAAQDQAQVDAVTQQLATETAKLAQAQSNYQNSRIGLAAEAAQREADPLARIKKLYDDKARAAEDAARREIKAGHDVTAALTAQLADIDRRRKAEVEAEQAREREAKKKPNERQIGRDIDLSQAEDIVHGIGGRITSSTRTYAQQQVLYDRYKAGEGPLAAKPGTSNHETGQALDIAMGGGMTLAKIRKAFEDQGVRITELLNEGDHFHVAWGKKGPSQETLDKRAQAASDRLTRTDEAFADMKSRAQEESLQLMRAQVTDIGQSSDFDRQRVEQERIRLNAAAQARADEAKSYDKTAQARADEIIALNDSNAQLKAQAIIRKEITDALAKQLKEDQDQLAGAMSILRLQGGLLTTPNAKRDNAMAQLANEEASRRDAANDLLWSTDPDDIKKGHAQLDQIDAEHPYRVADITRQTADPLEKFKTQLTENAGDINTALKGVEADGLKSLEDGLTGILDGTKSVADGFREMADAVIADLARIAIEEVLIGIFGLKDGGAAGSGSILHRAGGGAVFGAGGPRDDAIPAMLSNGEYVIKAEGYARHPALVEAINSGRLPAFADGGVVGTSNIYMRALPDPASLGRMGGGPAITFDMRGAVVTDDLLQQMNAISQQHATVAIVAGSNLAQSEIADQGLQRIPV